MYIHIISQELGEHNKIIMIFIFIIIQTIFPFKPPGIEKPCPRPIPPPRRPVFYSLMALSLLPPGQAELCAAAGLI